MKNKWLLGIMIIGVISGCATSPERLALQEKANRTVPVCTNGEDCNVKWEAAQLWVVHNAGYKIQSNTKVVIQTYNPTDSEMDIAVQVTKEPIGKGKYKIQAKIWCGNMFGCNPDTMSALLDFNRKVGAATP